MQEQRLEERDRREAPGGVAAREQVPDQEGYVVPTLAQGRQLDVPLREPPVEIGAEALLAHLRAQIPVGSADDGDVDGDLAAAAHGADLAHLEHAEELRLQVEGQLAELVEEQRPSVRGLEEPGPAAHRPGEGPAHVPEELAREHLPGEPRAVHRDQRPRAPAAGVQRLGDELLPGARLPRDEDREPLPRHQADGTTHPGDGVAVPDELRRGVAVVLRLVRRPRVHEQRRAEADDVPRLQGLDARDPPAVDEAAVPAAQIMEPEPTLVGLELGVAPRDGAVPEPGREQRRVPPEEGPRARDDAALRRAAPSVGERQHEHGARRAALVGVYGIELRRRDRRHAPRIHEGGGPAVTLLVLASYVPGSNVRG